MNKIYVNKSERDLIVKLFNFIDTNNIIPPNELEKGLVGIIPQTIIIEKE